LQKSFEQEFPNDWNSFFFVIFLNEYIIHIKISLRAYIFKFSAAWAMASFIFGNFSIWITSW